MVNALWAALEEHRIRPDRLIVLSHVRDYGIVKSVLPSLKALAGGFKVRVEPEALVVPMDSLKAALAKFLEVLREAKKQGEVVLDITPARKSLASMGMKAAQLEGISRILYLHLRKIELGDWPYPLIPVTMHEMNDLGAL